MKIKTELTNGLLIFAGIALYFLIMELLGLSGIYYLRALNALIVFYGINKTLKSNITEGKIGFLTNLLSAGLTAVIGVLLSAIGLLSYIYIRGADSYIKTLPNTFFLTGGNASVNEYCFGILFEGMASIVVIVLITMLLWTNETTSNN